MATQTLGTDGSAGVGRMMDEEKAVGGRSGSAAVTGPGLGDLLSEVAPGQGVSLFIWSMDLLNANVLARSTISVKPVDKIKISLIGSKLCYFAFFPRGQMGLLLQCILLTLEESVRPQW